MVLIRAHIYSLFSHEEHGFGVKHMLEVSRQSQKLYRRFTQVVQDKPRSDARMVLVMEGVNRHMIVIAVIFFELSTRRMASLGRA